MARVTRKGQITLPRAVREALGLEAGADIDFEVRDEGVLLRKRLPPVVFEAWRGFLASQGVRATTDELISELRYE
jgi:antitoxin PrlF